MIFDVLSKNLKKFAIVSLNYKIIIEFKEFIMDSCPYCKKDMSAKEPKEKAITLARKHGLMGEMCNPGGRSLIFPFGTVHLSDYCNYCDFEKLKKEIQELLSV